VPLLGWSLGGFLAREIARGHPSWSITSSRWGTPLHGPPETVSYRIYPPETVDHIKSTIQERDRQVIDVPVTAFYNRSDCIVPWQNCVDELSPRVENIEVSSTHIGMTLDPDIWSTLAHRLAGPDPRSHH